MAQKNRIRTIVLLLMMLSVPMLMMACGSHSGTSDTGTDDSSVSDSDDTERPDGWTDDTHGKNATPNYSVVFNEDVVGRIDLIISSENWKAMMADENIVSAYGAFGSQSSETVMPPVIGGVGMPPGGGAPPGGGGSEMTENPIWVPCTFMFNGITWNYVGVRFKGNSSLRDTWQKGIYKLPFRFDFDEFEDTYPAIDNQRFYGFKKLTLSSGYKDDSLIREKVVADLFRELGVPAPRTAFYRLFIDCGDGNGATYFGLYTMVEVPADPMLDEQFGSSDGNLYKPDGITASFGAGALAEADFDKETNDDEADYSDVNALYTAVTDTESDSETWKASLETVFNVDGFLNWLAVNTTIQNWDTYGIMTHNYYLYNDNGLLTWIPWDNNEALKGGDAASGGLTPLSLELNEESLANWPLISRLVEQPEYLAIYKSYLETTVDTYFNAATMEPIYQSAHDLIYDYVVGAEGEVAGYSLLSSEDAFINSLDYLYTHVENRVEDVNTYLGK